MKQEAIVYDYISLNVKSKLEQAYIDCYKHFGWTHIKSNQKTDYYINSNYNMDIVNIKFKRDRNIKNKDELLALQQKCEKAFLAIAKLEEKPHSIATMCSLIIAFIASAFCVVPILAMTGVKIILGVVILSGIIGLVGLIFPYFVYKKIKEKKEIEIKSKINECQDIISNTFENARKILIELE